MGEINLYDFLKYNNSISSPSLGGALNTLDQGLPTRATTPTLQSGPTTSTPTATSGGMAVDDRVRIGHLDAYQPTGGQYPGIQTPLAKTSGLMFPYTPTIQISQDVDYSAMQMVHSNTDYHYFNRSPNASVNISGKFTVQNQYEGRYAIGCIQFLRSVSKMNFGQADPNAGLPPPILTLSGHGTYMFNKVRVFVKTHSFTYDENMDVVNIRLPDSVTAGGAGGGGGGGNVRLPDSVTAGGAGGGGGGGNVRLPAMFTLSVSLTTQPTPNMMRTQFSLADYRSGALLTKGGWL